MNEKHRFEKGDIYFYPRIGPVELTDHAIESFGGKPTRVTKWRSLHESGVFTIPEGTVVVNPSILRQARTVLRKKPDLRAIVDNDGLHLRWGGSGGLDLREGGYFRGRPAADSPKVGPAAVVVPLVEKAA